MANEEHLGILRQGVEAWNVSPRDQPCISLLPPLRHSRLAARWAVSSPTARATRRPPHRGRDADSRFAALEPRSSFESPSTRRPLLPCRAPRPERRPRRERASWRRTSATRRPPTEVRPSSRSSRLCGVRRRRAFHARRPVGSALAERGSLVHPVRGLSRLSLRAGPGGEGIRRFCVTAIFASPPSHRRAIEKSTLPTPGPLDRRPALDRRPCRCAGPGPVRGGE